MPKEKPIHEVIAAQRPQYSSFTVKEVASFIFHGKVYAKVNSVAKSGMSRNMSFYVVKKGYIVNITQEIAALASQRYIDNEIKVGGCGMDMIFHVLYTAMARYRKYMESQGKKTTTSETTRSQRYRIIQ